MSHRTYLEKDKQLNQVLQQQPTVVLERRRHLCLYLCAFIMSQQLSTRVAQVMYQRFLALYGKKVPSAQQILDTPFETLRGIGLSNAKANYVQNVCRFFLEQKLTDARLYRMTDEEVVTTLTQIKGVGKWTAEMILMFGLQHEDVFPAGDLGIQQSMIKLYRLNPASKKELLAQMHKVAEKWRPYRTYACMYLWRWKHGE